MAATMHNALQHDLLLDIPTGWGTMCGDMTANGLKGLQVLVVEDDTLVLTLIEEFLAELGCDIAATATHLDDAVAKANTLAIDVAMLDLNLAGTLSYPVALALGARGIPFFFATSYGLTGLPADLHGAALLAKPFRLEHLADALHLATQSRRAM